MTPAPAAYAICGVVLIACGAYAIAVLTPEHTNQPPHDCVHLTLRERAAWFRFTHRFSRDLKLQLSIAWLEEHIDMYERRIRDHIREGGDT